MKTVFAITLLSCLLCTVAGRSGLRAFIPDKYPPMKNTGVDPGSPLFLTPYIEKKQFDLGEVFYICQTFNQFYTENP